MSVTIYAQLAQELGREPTHKEQCDRVRRIFHSPELSTPYGIDYGAMELQVAATLSDSETALAGLSPDLIVEDDFPMLFNAIAATNEDNGVVIGSYISHEEAEEALVDYLDASLDEMIKIGASGFAQCQYAGSFLIFSKVNEVLPL